MVFGANIINTGGSKHRILPVMVGSIGDLMGGRGNTKGILSILNSQVGI